LARRPELLPDRPHAGHRGAAPLGLVRSGAHNRNMLGPPAYLASASLSLPAPFFREAGAGPGVCLHASASHSTRWRALMDALVDAPAPPPNDADRGCRL